MDFPPGPDTPAGDVPDFKQLRATKILVQYTKKQAFISPSTDGYLSPCTTQNEVYFNDTLKYTSDALFTSLTSFDSLFCQSSEYATPLVKTLQTNSFSQRVAVQTYAVP